MLICREISASLPLGLIAIQPAEVLDVFRAFRGEGGIERDLLAAHAAGSGGRLVGVHDGAPPLADEAGELIRRHRPGEQKALYRVASQFP